MAGFQFVFNPSSDDIFGRLVTGTAKDEFKYAAIGDVSKYGRPSIDSFAREMGGFGYKKQDHLSEDCKYLVTDNVNSDTAKLLARQFPAVRPVEYSYLLGKKQKPVDGVIATCEVAVKLCIGLIGIMALFMGFMSIAEKAGGIRFLSKIVGPFFSKLFPEVPKGHPGNSCANGTGQCSMSLVRLTPLGTLDSGFGNGGLFTISYDTYAMTRAMAVQRDGKIVLVGSSWTTNNEHNTVVVRVNANGTLDSSFGLMGAVRINLSYAQTDVATDVAVGDDGRIFVAGYTYHQGNHKNFVLALNAYGDYDRGFRNGDMLYFTQTGYHYYDPNVAIDPDGRILITSQALRMQPYTWGMNISRILPNGTIDTAYGVNGYRFTTLGSGGIYTTSGIELLPTGEAMVAGTLSAGTSTNGSSKPFMARFTTSGALDPLFAGGVGYKNGDISSNSAYGTAGRFLDVAPDGKLYLGGYSEDMFYVLRYLGDPLDVAPAPVYFPERNQVPRATLQTSDVVTVSGLTAGARVPITVSGGSYIRNNGAATTQPGYVTNGDTLRLVHTAASGYSSQVTTTVTFGGLSPANNRSTVLGAATTASFTTITEADTGGNTPPGGGEES